MFPAKFVTRFEITNVHNMFAWLLFTKLHAKFECFKINNVHNIH
jgi:hypothetical protein